MIDSAFVTAGSVRPRSHPFAPEGRWSTYSRTACDTNSSASLATTSDEGCCSARKRIELSSHSASPPTTFSVRSGGSASSSGWSLIFAVSRKPHHTSALSPTVPVETWCTPSAVILLISLGSAGGIPTRLASRCGSLRGRMATDARFERDRRHPVDLDDQLARADVVITDQLVRDRIEGREMARRELRRDAEVAAELAVDDNAAGQPQRAQDLIKHVHSEGPAPHTYAAFRSIYPAA